MNILNLVEKNYFKTEGIPDFRPGDTLRVHVKVKEGVRERIQAFEGIVIISSDVPLPSRSNARAICPL